jgi:hypothetical protein
MSDEGRRERSVGSADGRPQHEVPYLRVRAPRRVVGVGGEGDPLAKITANRTGLLRLREQVDAALEADEGTASSSTYRETDERRYDLFVMRADRRAQMGKPREPERPDRSMFA